MKVPPTKVLKVLACLSIPSLLVACATQPPQEPTGSVSPATQYIYQTERNAQERMVTVLWVNPPKSADLVKETEDDDS